MRSIALLGATGSIGASALDVIARHPERFSLFAVTAARSVESLVDLCARFRPRFAVIADEARWAALRDALRAAGLPTTPLAGAAALAEVAGATECDTVVAAIVGAAGLVPTIAAARAGKRVLLANKESVVCAGRLLIDAVRAGGGELLPVDSEHSAIHQCLAGARAADRDVRKLILTASGGPFRTRSDFAGITPEQACAHPNWVVGRQISVDSATLTNKRLEVIEASWLFGFPAGRSGSRTRITMEDLYGGDVRSVLIGLRLGTVGEGEFAVGRLGLRYVDVSDGREYSQVLPVTLRGSADTELVAEVRNFLDKIQAAQEERRALRRRKKAIRKALANCKSELRAELGQRGLRLKGYEVRGWRTAGSRKAAREGIAGGKDHE